MSSSPRMDPGALSEGERRRPGSNAPEMERRRRSGDLTQGHQQVAANIIIAQAGGWSWEWMPSSDPEISWFGRAEGRPCVYAKTLADLADTLARKVLES